MSLGEGPADEPTPAPAAGASELHGSLEIAGLHGLRTHGDVRFAAASELAHVLDTLLLFPDRARAQLVVAAAPQTSGWIEMRKGGQLHRRAGPLEPLVELEGEAALELALRLERRRALFLYPHGFEWVDGALEALPTDSGAALGERHARIEPVPGGGPGWLWVELDAAGAPLELGAVAGGRQLGSLRVLERSEVQGLPGRELPSTLQFLGPRTSAAGDAPARAGELIWTERLTTAETDLRFRDPGVFEPGKGPATDPR